MNPFAAQAGATLLETLASIAAVLISAKNPNYAPIINPVLTSLNNEIAALFGGADLTPHGAPTPAPVALPTAPPPAVSTGTTAPTPGA